MFSIKYSIVASKVVRPSTIFQIVASLGPETEACRVMASISRDGVAVTTNEALLGPDQSQGILLKVPPDNRYEIGLIKKIEIVKLLNFDFCT